MNRLLAVPFGQHVDAAIDGLDHVAREFKRILLVCQFHFTLARTQRAGVFIFDVTWAATARLDVGEAQDFISRTLCPADCQDRSTGEL